MSIIQNSNAVRCPECGFRKPAGTQSCPRCGAQQTSPSTTVLDWDNAIAGQLVPTQEDGALQAPPVVQADDLLVAIPAGQLEPFVSSRTSLEPHPQPAVAASEVTACQGAELTGRVIAVDNSREPPDFDLCRMLTKILWALLVLVSPLLVFGHTLVALGPIVALTGIAGVVLLLRVIPMSNLLWFAYMAHANRRPEEQVPVCYVRVRNLEDESEVMVRLKGFFNRGNVAPDDLVGFWGSWRDGVLMADHGFNQRTQSVIQFRRSHWWIWLLLTAILAVTLAIHFQDTWATLNNMANCGGQ